MCSLRAPSPLYLTRDPKKRNHNATPPNGTVPVYTGERVARAGGGTPWRGHKHPTTAPLAAVWSGAARPIVARLLKPAQRWQSGGGGRAWGKEGQRAAAQAWQGSGPARQRHPHGSAVLAVWGGPGRGTVSDRVTRRAPARSACGKGHWSGAGASEQLQCSGVVTRVRPVANLEPPSHDAPALG